MVVITVSSQFGAGGPAVGKQLAERLDMDYLDKELIHQVALDLKIPDAKVAEFDEARHSPLRGFLSTVFDFAALRRGADAVAGEDAESSYDDREEIPYDYRVQGWIDKDIYRTMMARVMSSVGDRGGAVIKGRGSQWILRDVPHAIHLRFIGDVEDRVARTMERRGIDASEARTLVDEMDRRGAEFVRSYFDCDLTDPALYHLTLNTSKLPPEQCLELLIHLVRDREAK